MALCQLCNHRPAKHKHHLLSQTAKYRKLYFDLIDDPRNIMHLCPDCHMMKPLDKMDEIEFAKMMGIKPRSKSALFKINQGKLESWW